MTKKSYALLPYLLSTVTFLSFPNISYSSGSEEVMVAYNKNGTVLNIHGSNLTDPAFIETLSKIGFNGFELKDKTVKQYEFPYEQFNQPLYEGKYEVGNDYDRFQKAQIWLNNFQMYLNNWQNLLNNWQNSLNEYRSAYLNNAGAKYTPNFEIQTPITFEGVKSLFPLPSFEPVDPEAYAAAAGFVLEENNCTESILPDGSKAYRNCFRSWSRQE